MHAPMQPHTSIQLHSDERHHQHSLAAAMNWLFPYAVGATTAATATTHAPSQPHFPSPSSSPAFGAGGAGAKKETDSVSSSSSSSSSASDAFSFSTSGQQSPSASTSALCFGAGGTGMRLWSSSKTLARASKIHEEEKDDAQQAAASVATMGRRLRRISRRLREARVANKETPAAPPRRGAAIDGTAHERAEAVASAIAHCKETLRRGMPRRRRRLPPPLSSLSLDLWLRDRQGEIIASAAAHCDDECVDAPARPPAAVFPTALAGQAPRLRLPHIHGGRERESAAAAAVATGTGTPSSTQISGPVAGTETETETRGSFSELEFLETFDGDEELIDRHFITVQI